MLVAYGAWAAPRLPPDVQTDLLKTKILQCLQSKDFTCVLEAADQFNALSLPMPPPLRFIEAEVAFKTGDSLRAFNALKAYLAEADHSKSQYKDALQLYGKYEAAAEPQLLKLEEEKLSAEKAEHDAAIRRVLDAQLKLTHEAESQPQLVLADYRLQALAMLPGAALVANEAAALQKQIDSDIDHESTDLAARIASQFQPVTIPAGKSLDIRVGKVVRDKENVDGVVTVSVNLDRFTIAKEIVSKSLKSEYLAQVCKGSLSVIDRIAAEHKLSAEQVIAKGWQCEDAHSQDAFVIWLNRYVARKFRLPTIAEYLRATFGDSITKIDFKKYADVRYGTPEFGKMIREFVRVNQLGVKDIGFGYYNSLSIFEYNEALDGHVWECVTYWFGTDRVDVQEVGRLLQSVGHVPTPWCAAGIPTRLVAVE